MTPSRHKIRGSSAPPRQCRTAVALALLSAVGCRSHGAETYTFAPPALRSSTDHFAGSALTGPIDGGDPARIAAANTEQALRITCEIRFVRGTIDATYPFVPLASRARLIFATRGSETLLANPRFSERAFGGQGDEALARVSRPKPMPDAEAFAAGSESLGQRSVTELAFLEGAALAGTTTDFQVIAVEPIAMPPRQPFRRRVRILVSRDPQASAMTTAETGPTLALVIDDLVASGAPDVRAGAILEEEVVLLQDRVPVDGEPIVLGIQSPLGDGYFVAVVRARSAPAEDGAAQQFERVLATAKRSIVLPRHAPTPSTSTERELRDSVRALADPSLRRKALVNIARATDSRLTEDVALVASDALLTRYAEATIAETFGYRHSHEELVPDRIGAILERVAIALLAEEKNAEQLPPELDAALVRHCGEVGRLPRLLRDLARTAPPTLAEMREILVQENMAFLEDVRTAARVRATRWLATRGHLPNDYDPFASRRDRRTVLRRNEEMQRSKKRDGERQ